MGQKDDNQSKKKKKNMKKKIIICIYQNDRERIISLIHLHHFFCSKNEQNRVDFGFWINYRLKIFFVLWYITQYNHYQSRNFLFLYKDFKLDKYSSYT